MSRSILDEAHIHPAIREAVSGSHADIVREVQDAIAGNDVVVGSRRLEQHQQFARDHRGRGGRR